MHNSRCDFENRHPFSSQFPTANPEKARHFHPSTQFLYGWRRFLLKSFGARIGQGVLIRPSVTVTYPWKVTIGDWNWVGVHATLCALGLKN